MSTYTPEAVIDYFKSMGSSISMQRWLEMGWRPTVRASPAKAHSLHGRDRDDMAQRSTRPEQKAVVW
jgi:hypothetical protein